MCILHVHVQYHMYWCVHVHVYTGKCLMRKNLSFRSPYLSTQEIHPLSWQVCLILPFPSTQEHPSYQPHCLKLEVTHHQARLIQSRDMWPLPGLLSIRQHHRCYNTARLMMEIRFCHYFHLVDSCTSPPKSQPHSKQKGQWVYISRAFSICVWCTFQFMLIYEPHPLFNSTYSMCAFYFCMCDNLCRKLGTIFHHSVKARVH